MVRYSIFFAAEQDHRHIGRVLVIEPFGPQAVIAEHIAVVGGKANNSIVEQSFFAQSADD